MADEFNPDNLDRMTRSLPVAIDEEFITETRNCLGMIDYGVEQARDMLDAHPEWGHDTAFTMSDEARKCLLFALTWVVDGARVISDYMRGLDGEAQLSCEEWREFQEVLDHPALDFLTRRQTIA